MTFFQGVSVLFITLTCAVIGIYSFGSLETEGEINNPDLGPDLSEVDVAATQTAEDILREFGCRIVARSVHEGSYTQCGIPNADFYKIPVELLPSDCKISKSTFATGTAGHHFKCEEGQAYGRKGSNINFTQTKGVTLAETEQSFANDKQEKFIKGFLYLGHEGALYGTFLSDLSIDVRESTPTEYRLYWSDGLSVIKIHTNDTSKFSGDDLEDYLKQLVPVEAIAAS